MNSGGKSTKNLQQRYITLLYSKNKKISLCILDILSIQTRINTVDTLDNPHLIIFINNTKLFSTRVNTILNEMKRIDWIV